MFQCACPPLGQTMRAKMLGSLGKPSKNPSISSSYFSKRFCKFSFHFFHCLSNCVINLWLHPYYLYCQTYVLTIFTPSKETHLFLWIFFINWSLIWGQHRWGTTTEDGVQAEILQGSFLSSLLSLSLFFMNIKYFWTYFCLQWEHSHRIECS